MASAVEDDTSEGAGLESVGGNDVNLGVRSEFEEGAGAVKTGGAGDDVSGGVMLEYVVIETGEVVKVRVGKGDEVGDESLREAFVGETMGKRANVFLDSADGPLDIGDMAVGIDDVKMDVGKSGGQGDEFVVDMAGADVETTGFVKGDDGGKVAPHFGFLTGGSWEGVAKTEGAGDAVEEGDALDVKEIKAKGDVAVMGEDVRRDGSGESGRDMTLGDGGGVAFKAGDVGTVNETGTTEVIRGDGAVAEVAVGDGMFENGIAGAAKENGEMMSGVGILELAASKLPFVGGYRR
jgi:hypothetical protein